MKILVTGGAGFIGSNFIKFILDKYGDRSIINLDKLTYAGNLKNLDGYNDHEFYTFVQGDIADSGKVEAVFSEFDHIDFVVNFAAESHVDRSIDSAKAFLKSNILGTEMLLEVAQKVGVRRFIQISTDEVYGHLGEEGEFTEKSELAPSSPYSSSKASADLIAFSYFKTYGLPVVITRCSNNYGPNQYPEKLIPLLTTNAIEGKKLPVYGEGKNVRDWIHVSDHCRAIDTVVNFGEPGEVYNIGGDSERRNIEIAKIIADKTGVGEEAIEFVKDRLGHDYRYAIDHSKITRELGWKPQIDFEEGIRETIEWYKNNENWWKPLKK